MDRAETLRRDVLVGLTAAPKFLLPKWFYDKVGSELLDQIARLVEYSPTEAECSALTRHVDEIVSIAGCDTLVELGSGSSDQTGVLLEALGQAGSSRRYVPFDVSESALREAAVGLRARFPGLLIDGVVGDVDQYLSRIPPGGKRMVVFLGGTIGNDTPGDRR